MQLAKQAQSIATDNPRIADTLAFAYARKGLTDAALEQYRYAIGADYVRDSGMRISGSLVYADYGDAEIDSNRAPPAFGLKGKYKTNEIWFANVSFNWPLGGGSR